MHQLPFGFSIYMYVSIQFKSDLRNICLKFIFICKISQIFQSNSYCKWNRSLFSNCTMTYAPKKSSQDLQHYIYIYIGTFFWQLNILSWYSGIDGEIKSIFRFPVKFAAVGIYFLLQKWWNESFGQFFFFSSIEIFFLGRKILRHRWEKCLTQVYGNLLAGNRKVQKLWHIVSLLTHCTMGFAL